MLTPAPTSDSRSISPAVHWQQSALQYLKPAQSFTPCQIVSVTFTLQPFTHLSQKPDSLLCWSLSRLLPACSAPTLCYCTYLWAAQKSCIPAFLLTLVHLHSRKKRSEIRQIASLMHLENHPPHRSNNKWANLPDFSHCEITIRTAAPCTQMTACVVCRDADVNVWDR